MPSALDKHTAVASIKAAESAVDAIYGNIQVARYLTGPDMPVGMQAAIDLARGLREALAIVRQDIEASK